jgi:hypothetical protein
MKAQKDQHTPMMHQCMFIDLYNTFVASKKILDFYLH